MIDGQTLHLTASEAIGLTGALIYATGYLLSAYDKLPSQSPAYYGLKLLAALCVLISLAQNFNLASAVIQVFFIAVSLVGIARHAERSSKPQATFRSKHPSAPPSR